VNGTLADGNNAYNNQWTRSIAVGDEEFVQKIKEGLGTKALGRRIREVPGGYELRERVASYIADFSPKKEDIGLENTYDWKYSL
jgi:hypothetical protein